MDRDQKLVKAFATVLKRRRNKLKLSQEELAHRAGVNRTFIAKLELSKNQPSLVALYHLSSALECKLPELIVATLSEHIELQATESVSKAFGPLPAKKGKSEMRELHEAEIKRLAELYLPGGKMIE